MGGTATEPQRRGPPLGKAKRVLEQLTDQFCISPCGAVRQDSPIPLPADGGGCAGSSIIPSDRRARSSLEDRCGEPRGIPSPAGRGSLPHGLPFSFSASSCDQQQVAGASRHTGQDRQTGPQRIQLWTTQTLRSPGARRQESVAAHRTWIEACIKSDAGGRAAPSARDASFWMCVHASESECARSEV